MKKLLACSLLFTFLLTFLSPQTLAAYLPNAVGSSTAHQRIEYARVSNNGATCALVSQSGSFSAVVRTGPGNCTLSFYTGAFSAAPICSCISSNNSSARVCALTSPTTSTVDTFLATSSTGSAVDSQVDVMCIGTH